MITEWLDWKNKDFNGTYKLSKKDNYKYIGYDIHDFDIEKNFFKFKEIDKKDLTSYISYETYKKMFPLLKHINYLKDWGTKFYKYKDYFIIQRSGYYYFFEKINKTNEDI